MSSARIQQPHGPRNRTASPLGSDGGVPPAGRLGALLDTLDVTQVPPGVVLPAALAGIAVRLLVGWKHGGGQPLIALGFLLLCASVLTTLVQPGSGNEDSITLGDG